MSNIVKHRRAKAVRTFFAAAVCLSFSGLVMAQPKIEISATAERDPHPIAYSFEGEYTPVTEPGPYFYYFFYTGTVSASASVSTDVKIQRLAIPLREWEVYYDTLVSQIETFYEASMGGATVNDQPYYTPQGEQVLTTRVDNDGNLLPGGASANAAGAAQTNAAASRGLQFDTPSFQYQAARAAAEWTFYYDQVILWEYYCARNLLKQDIYALDNASSGEEGEGEQEGVGQPEQPGGSQGAAGSSSDEDNVRKVFNPTSDYMAQLTDDAQEMAMDERAHYQQLVDDQEKLVFDTYMNMLKEIDTREVNQQNYEFWLDNKRREIYEFAEEWRKVKDGEIMFLDDSLYLVTNEPLASGPLEATNIVVQERLTPQDLISDEGSLIKREVE